MPGPDPHNPFPMVGQNRVCFLRAVVDQRNIEIGEHTYYDDPVEPERFVEKCVLYHYDFLGDRLIIGKFCALAAGVRFVMNGANHSMTGISTYPFQIFGGEWLGDFDVASYLKEARGDTVVGHDVWIGMDATILPGVQIGHGAVIGAKSVVAKDVPPYAIVAGNPSRIIRKRFPDETIQRLLQINWWNWDIARITRNISRLRGGDVDALEREGEPGSTATNVLSHSLTNQSR